MTKLLALMLACLALGLAACGGDDDDDGGGGGGGGASTTEQPSSGGGGGVQVGLKNIQFNPKNVTVKPGVYQYVCHVHAPGMAGTITVK